MVGFEVVREGVVGGFDGGEEVGEAQERFAGEGFGEEGVGEVAFGEVKGGKGFEEVGG